jgi:hypothetical protein
MTTHYHEPLTAAEASDISEINERLGDLDAAIYSASVRAGGFLQATLGEDVGDRNAAYLNLADNKIYLMDADAAGPKAGKIRGFIDGTGFTGNTGTLVISGILNGFTGLTPFATVYVSTTLGGITQTKPSPSLGGGQLFIAELGFAISATEIFINPKPIHFMLRDAMALNDTLTISHHADILPYQRNPTAYIVETQAGATLESYASANQDSNVALSDATPATYTADLCTGGTAIGDMTASGGLAAAFDNNNATAAAKGSSTTGIIGYDFGVGITKTIRRYTLQESTAAVSANMFKDWKLQYSSDNTNWNDADTRTNETAWADGEKRTFDVSAPYTARYWRINCSVNNGGTSTAVGEVEMMEAATFTNGFSKLAQTFTLASTEDIAQVDLWLKKVGSPTGTVTVRIETVSGSDPTGTLAHANATATFAESSLGTSYAAKLVSFTEFSLGAGTYAIVISTSRAASETDYIHWGADASSPGYAGGSMRQYNGAWAAASKDAVFTLYGPIILHPSDVAIDHWASTNTDLSNRYGDGAGANLTTQTTFKCLLAAGFDDITLVVVLE